MTKTNTDPWRCDYCDKTHVVPSLARWCCTGYEPPKEYAMCCDLEDVCAGQCDCCAQRGNN